jgi:hypothetical protein
VVERARKRHRRSVAAAHEKIASLDNGAEARNLDAKLAPHRDDGSIVRWWGGEAKLVVVAAGENALERDRSLVACEQSLRRGRARQGRELNLSADGGRLQDMRQVSDQAI